MIGVHIRLGTAVRDLRPGHDPTGIVDCDDPTAGGGKVDRLGDVIWVHLADTVVRELAGSHEREDRVDVSARCRSRHHTGREIGQSDDPGLRHLTASSHPSKSGPSSAVSDRAQRSSAQPVKS